jgi:hypothetical protein
MKRLKAIECEGAGMHDGWSSLASVIEKSDILEHHDDPYIPMQLRMLMNRPMVMDPVDTMAFRCWDL